MQAAAGSRYRPLKPRTWKITLETKCSHFAARALVVRPLSVCRAIDGSVMDCHATARGSIPGGNDVFTELHVLRKGQ